MKNQNVNWYALKAAALTAVRVSFPVEMLQVMASNGDETPASGDAMTLAFATGEA